MPSRLPAIKEFREQLAPDRIWRIDWLGSVRRAQAELLVGVLMSPARPEIAVPSIQDHFDSKESKLVWIDIGQLPMLVAGSLWRNGRCLKKQIGEVVDFTDVSVSAESITHVPSRLAISTDPKRWMIPRFKLDFTWHGDKSECLAVAHAGEPYGIVLPVMEAIRFYYACSSDLAHIAFTGAYQLDLNRIINTKSFGMVDGTDIMYLKRRRWLSNQDCWTIGRVLASPVAAKGVAKIYDSILAKQDSPIFRYPSCHLPFEGQANWKARCIKIKIKDGPDGKPVYRYLILEMLNCSAPFPFGQLHVDADNNSKKADKPEKDLPEEEKRPGWANATRTAERGEDDELQSNALPDPDIRTEQVSLPGDRFSAIKNKEIIETPKEHCEYRNAGLREPEGFAGLSTGQLSEAGTGMARTSLALDMAERTGALPATLESFKAVAEALNKIPGVTAERRPAGNDLDRLIPLPPIKRKQWAYLDHSKRVCRRVVIFDVAFDGIFGSIVEFEQRKKGNSCMGVVVSRLGSPIEDPLLFELLRKLVSAKGVWRQIKGVPFSLRVGSLRHTRTTVEKFAADIVDKLRELLSQS